MPRRDEQPTKSTGTVRMPPRATTPKAKQEDEKCPCDGCKGDKLSESKAMISYNIQFTKSLGNYEFIRIGAELTLPVDADEEVLEKAQEQMVIIRDKVIERLSNDISDVTAALT